MLANPGRVCPAYDPKEGYELAGFIRFQGFNDMVDSNFYLKQLKGAAGNRFALYSEYMSALIRDVRKDLGAPKLPFVIGVMGVGGKDPRSDDNLAFREAMAAPNSWHGNSTPPTRFISKLVRQSSNPMLSKGRSGVTVTFGSFPPAALTRTVGAPRLCVTAAWA